MNVDGGKIRKLRMSKKLSQLAFSEIIGVSRQTVNNWENNRNSPNLNQIARLAEFFKTTGKYFIKEF